MNNIRNAINSLLGKADALAHTESQRFTYLFLPSPGAPANFKAVANECYLRIQMSRVYLRYSSELFVGRYPVVQGLFKFNGLNPETGTVDEIALTNIIDPASISALGAPQGQPMHADYSKVIQLNLPLLHQVVYKGGGVDLMVGLFAAPGDNWARRYTQLAQNLTESTGVFPLTAAISLTSVVLTSLQNLVNADAFDLRVALHTLLETGNNLRPGNLVLIAAPSGEIVQSTLTIENDSLYTSGQEYDAHDYILLSVEMPTTRSDWQKIASINRTWSELMTLAATEADINKVKAKWIAFYGIVQSCEELTYTDRDAVVQVAKDRVTKLRQGRNVPEFETTRSASFGTLGDTDEVIDLQSVKNRKSAAPSLMEARGDWLN